MKDQLSGQLKMLIVRLHCWTYKIDLLQPGYYVPFNLNFVQYFWLKFFWLILKSMHRISQT